MTTTNSRSNRTVVLACIGAVCGMAGLAYASVPLYQLFCQVTGYGGTTQRSELLTDIPVLDREMIVRFDANTAGGLKWKFAPVERQVKVKLGEQVQISYTAENITDRPLTGTATFNVTPQHAGAYFNKIECFCFTETTLQPGEKIDMPVVFFVDPELDQEEIMEKLNTITLSYTMFEDEETPVASVEDKNKQEALN